MAGMALPAGESPALRYLIKAEPPVKSAPSLSGCVTGIIAPSSRIITGEKLGLGDHIVGATSSGLHSNGISLVIKRAMALPEKFLTRLPNGNTLGEEALTPTRSYVALVEALLEAEVDIHALLPGTGSGVSKVAFDSRPFTYRIHTWVEVPPLFQFMREIGVSLEDCITTFNWGIGYYIFVPSGEVEHTIETGSEAGYQLVDLGQVEEGERKVIFEPEGITLPPPGE
jgi:phosphoribosylformylglycinamidine cyclo-ligase